jgi:molybdate transport system ATP-binding protein
VTHDWAEALALGDVVSVVADGKILQTGPPQDVFCRPNNADIAKIIGVETVVAGRISAVVQGLVRVDIGGVTVTAVGADDHEADVFVCIRGEDVTLEHGGVGITSARNHLPARVVEITSLGAMARVTLDCSFPLVATVTRSTVEEFGLAVGRQTFAAIKAGSVHLVPRRDH